MPKRIEIENEVIAAAYNELRSPSKVAAALGISKTTVERRLQEHGAVRCGQRGLSRKLPQSVANEYLAGASMNELAKKYGACLPTVAEALKRAGVESRPRGNVLKVLSAETIAEIVRLYTEENLSQAKIAKQLGTSQIIVSRHLRAQGVTSGRNHVGRITMAGGYIGVLVEKNDPMRGMAGSTGYAMEHRLVMARHFGRALKRHETVHHINGDKTDNRIENLQLRSGQHGKGVVHRCRNCGSTNIESVRIN